MNAEDSENKPETVFKSIRFEKDLAGRLGDYVHAKKKIRKTSMDAEVQRAVCEMLDRERFNPSSTNTQVKPGDPVPPKPRREKPMRDVGPRKKKKEEDDD